MDHTWIQEEKDGMTIDAPGDTARIVFICKATLERFTILSLRRDVGHAFDAPVVLCLEVLNMDSICIITGARVRCRRLERRGFEMMLHLACVASFEYGQVS